MKEKLELSKMVALRQAFRSDSNRSFRRVNYTSRLIAGHPLREKSQNEFAIMME